MLKVYIIGLFILLAAIFLNGLVNKLGILSWYDFINKLISPQKQSIRELTFIEYCWLFFVYPFLLGVAAWAGNWLFTLVTSKP